ncbi:MAG: hypothetical protein JWQ54_2235 [Mucilaginibacter sp.]|nr:hypothetical protein [Mucilaginibacter sp.]
MPLFSQITGKWLDLCNRVLKESSLYNDCDFINNMIARN